MVSLPLLEKYTNQRGFLSLVVDNIIIINLTHELNLAMPKSWKLWKVNKTNSKFPIEKYTQCFIKRQ